ncbi:MAG: dihydrodipicolinate synthase family protein [Bacteroidetes bacterium]|nr:dihydrodipicolinate synthase family protein [Bacteroidota bacterium]MCL5027193.1 dihydrodipicolinate synthase family protein [Chloroflexota bacterium]
MSQGGELHGIIPVLATPFLDDGAVDYEGLRAVARYCLSQGAHGLAATGEASESSKLTPDERRRSVEVVADEMDGEAWLVVGVSAPEGTVAAGLARHAGSMGAAAVFATPRGDEGATPDAIYAYYATIAEAGVPVMVQEQTAGVPIPLDLYLRMAEEIPAVRYIKQESIPAGRRITEILLGTGGRIKAFSGAGGRFLMADLARGVMGCLPGSVGVRQLVRAYELYRAGQPREAREVFDTYVPLASFRSQFGIPAAKEALLMQGIIRSAAQRPPVTYEFDAHDRDELRAILEQMARA